ncbi:MAG: hypothetical protein MJ227_03700 [Bacilli bacterium]|nr:hypothetical protein [Bacilli bacterium]
MNKLFKRISAAILGFALAAGVGVGIAQTNGEAMKTNAYTGTFVLAKSANDVAVGSKVIIVASGYNHAMSTTQNGNNRGQEEITKSSDKSTITNPSNSVQVFTVEAGTQANTKSFYTGSGYIYAASSGSNYLKTENNKSDNSSWTISINNDSGVATVKAQGTNLRNVLQYNSTSEIFSCYSSSSQKGISIYVEQSAQPTKGTLSIEPVDKNEIAKGATGTFSHKITGGSKTALKDQAWRSDDTTKLEFTNNATGEYKAKELGSVTVYLSGTDGDNFTYDEVSYTLTVVTPEPGTKYNPYSVATALTKSDEEDVYTKGIISYIDEVSVKYGNATYFISDDGSRNNELKIFRGLFLGGANFTSENQIQVGDTVVVFGDITTYQETAQYNTNNYIDSLRTLPRLSLTPDSVELTKGLSTTVTANPLNFDEGTVTYVATCSGDPLATVTHIGNTLTVTAGSVTGEQELTITGYSDGVEQAEAVLTVKVVEPFPTKISRTKYTSFTDEMTFAEGDGSLKITYSDGSEQTKRLGNQGVQLYINSEEVDANTSAAPYKGENSGKITYTENGKTVETSAFKITVTALLEIVSVDNVPETLLIDPESDEHSAEVEFAYTSEKGEPTVSVTSSSPEKLIISDLDYDFDETEKYGLGSFTVTAGTVQGQFTVVIEVTAGGRTESRTFSVTVITAHPEPGEASYVKVTSTSKITSGKYLIVAECNNVALNGMLTADAANNGVSVTITDNEIESNTVTDNAAFTIDAADGTMLGGSGYYVYHSGTSNTLNYTQNKSSAGTTLSIDNNGNFVSAVGNYVLRYNNGTGTSDKRFRYYKGTQDYVQLYKYTQSGGEKTPFELVKDFVDNYMMMGAIPTTDRSDTGACRGENGYYLTAKKAWNAMVASYQGTENLHDIFRDSFEDAYARYLDWAKANNDNNPFDGNDTIVSSNNLLNSLGQSNDYMVLIVIIGGVLASFVTMGFVLHSKKKKQIH